MGACPVGLDVVPARPPWPGADRRRPHGAGRREPLPRRAHRRRVGGLGHVRRRRPSRGPRAGAWRARRPRSRTRRPAVAGGGSGRGSADGRPAARRRQRERAAIPLRGSGDATCGAGGRRAGMPGFRVPSEVSPGTPPSAVPATGGSAAPPVREYTVGSGDTLWGIADRMLGDGAEWPEIARLTYGRTQPDGGRLGPSHVLRPGWKVMLPPKAVGRRATGGDRREHVVEPGETLSGIAARELGDANRYPELMAATEHLDQPGGAHLQDPDLIYPGWIVGVPATGVRSAVTPMAALRTQRDGHGRPAALPAARTSPAPVHPAHTSSQSPTARRPGPPAAPADPGWTEASGVPAHGSGHASAPMTAPSRADQWR